MGNEKNSPTTKQTFTLKALKSSDNHLVMIDDGGGTDSPSNIQWIKKL